MRASSEEGLLSPSLVREGSRSSGNVWNSNVVANWVDDQEPGAELLRSLLLRAESDWLDEKSFCWRLAALKSNKVQLLSYITFLILMTFQFFLPTFIHKYLCFLVRFIQEYLRQSTFQKNCNI